jgi:hypothetical protein
LKGRETEASLQALFSRRRETAASFQALPFKRRIRVGMGLHANGQQRYPMNPKMR